MRKHVTALITFFIPIIRQAVLQVTADTVTKVAYPDSKRRGYTNYSRRRMTPEPTTRRQAIRNVGRAVREADAYGMKFTHEGKEFHDVLLVAFDISGPSHAEVCTWLRDNMPETGLGGDEDEIYLDAWWIADDKSMDDTDSAVFVRKGWQERARRLLRLHNMVD